MEQSKLYEGTWNEVMEAQNKELLEACEKAIVLILSNDWRAMNYDKATMCHPRAEFRVEDTRFTSCKLRIINDAGNITTKLIGQHSGEKTNNRFCVDLSTHPQVEKHVPQYLNAK